MDIINLGVTGEIVRVINNTRTLLTLNKPFTFIIHSNISYGAIICYDIHTSHQHIRTPLKQIIGQKGYSEYSYTLPENMNTTVAMNSIWRCKLYYDGYIQHRGCCTVFHLNVHVKVQDPFEAYFKKTQQFDYDNPTDYLRNDDRVYQTSNNNYHSITINNEEENAEENDEGMKTRSYGQPVKNIKEDTPNFDGTKTTATQHYPFEENDGKIDITQSYGQPAKNIEENTSNANPNETTATQQYASVKNNGGIDIQTNEQPTKDNNSNSNANVLIIIICVVIALTGIIVGVFIGTMSRKFCCKNTPTEDSLHYGLSMDPVYEELNVPQPVAPNDEALNVGCRAPCPLPPEASEENKKYIHYDTPYDHRFDRRIPLRLCGAPHPQRNANMLRRV